MDLREELCWISPGGRGACFKKGNNKKTPTQSIHLLALKELEIVLVWCEKER